MMTWNIAARSAAFSLLFCCSFLPVVAEQPTYFVGAARIDVTPQEPMRLSGYGSRRAVSEGVSQPLYAKAVAIQAGQDAPAVWIMVDNCGVPASVTEAVRSALLAKAGILPERIAICSTHTHTGPCLTGVLPNLFSTDIPDDQQRAIDRYTGLLTEQLEKVALGALGNRRPGKLAWSQGRLGFAKNRRTAGGPVDDTFSLLRLSDEQDNLVAVVVNYACHGTTLPGSFNQVHGDWAGCAQARIEAAHPGAVAVVTLGCAGDANPNPRGTVKDAEAHGQEVQTEVERMLAEELRPLSGGLQCRLSRLRLPFAPLPSREEWEDRARQPGIVGYHARKNLGRLERGETLPKNLPYQIQSWNFGDNLEVVFLAGEVVVDYSIRLKKLLDPSRLWINAYANDVPCYIPSRRILREGGYEAEDSLWYYDRPARLAPAVEETIVDSVLRLVPRPYHSPRDLQEFPPPRTAEESLNSIRLARGMKAELVAAEPLVVDPVAIDFGVDGKLWVVEMHDYPTGLDGDWKPGGRVKFLEDTDSDGLYDRATLFLDSLPFPTGLMAWKGGVLVCAAPDILYAEDTDGDGRADKVRKLFTGFATQNYQARVNGLSFGLDNWVYGSSGLFGGKTRGLVTGEQVDLQGRDFRFEPDTGRIEAVSGLSQQGRVHDDWGNWFGNDNSTWLWHYPLTERAMKRNPFVVMPKPRVLVAQGSDPNRLFPVSHTLERFNDPASVKRTTSACGPEIYRDSIFGPEYAGNAFVCEPVHNLVHRLVLSRVGVTFSGRRAPQEQEAEFLASSDNWFRPVQVRTGPDGALWVVDMYRFVIEHPRWISAERLAQLDVRAGDEQGRIYRVYPAGAVLRPIRNLRQLKTPELVSAMETENGVVRDLVQRELFHRQGQEAVRPLRDKVRSAAEATVRMQSLCALDGLHALDADSVSVALQDEAPGVRRQAARMAAHLKGPPAALKQAVMALADDPDPGVRFQVALTLGNTDWDGAGQAMARVATQGLGDGWLRAAVLCSAVAHTGAILEGVLATPPDTPGRAEMVGQLMATAAGGGSNFSEILAAAAPGPNEAISAWRLEVLACLRTIMERRQIDFASLRKETDPEVQRALASVEATIDRARLVCRDGTAEPAERVAAIQLLGWEGNRQDWETLLGFLSGPTASREAAVAALRSTADPALYSLLFKNWRHATPAVRGAILEILLSRDEGSRYLEGALATGRIQPAEIPAPDRQKLLRSHDPHIRESAASLFPEASVARGEVLAKFDSAGSLDGSVARGEGLFVKLCSSCHLLHGVGHSVGPDLAALASKTPRDFLLAILDPSAAIDPRYLLYNVDLKDGRNLSGIISEETANSLVLLQSGGSRETLLRSQVAELTASAVSLMPEGLEQGLVPQDLADLVAFLKQHPAPFGSATRAQSLAARRKFMELRLPGVAKLVSAAEELPYPSWIGTLPLALCRQTKGQSRLSWTSSVDSETTDGRSVFCFPAAMGFSSQPARGFELRIDGAAVLRFDVVLDDHIWENEDGSVRAAFHVKENNTEDSNGILRLEVSRRLLTGKASATFEVTGLAGKSQRWFGVYLLPAS